MIDAEVAAFSGLLIDCERVALQSLFNLLHRTKLGRQVELHKRTLQMALFSVIGPDAPALATRIMGFVRVSAAAPPARGKPLCSRRARWSTKCMRCC